MRIIEIEKLEEKRKHLPLLLEADPSEPMIMRYLPRGRVFLLQRGETPPWDHISPKDVLGLVVMVDLGGGKCEIKNLAVAPGMKMQGYGRLLIEHAASVYADDYGCSEMLVGTSESGASFYEKCKFTYLHRVPGFFTQNYPDPIYEHGEGNPPCTDMVYLRRPLRQSPLLSVCFLQTHSLT